MHDITLVSPEFENRFMEKLFSEHTFELKFKIGDETAYHVFKGQYLEKKEHVEEKEQVEEKEIKREFDKEVGIVLKRLKTIIYQTDDYLSET
jgi:hypothetical protein